jgi:hypothetical protein
LILLGDPAHFSAAMPHGFAHIVANANSSRIAARRNELPLHGLEGQLNGSDQRCLLRFVVDRSDSRS